MAIRYKRLEETWADVQKASRRSERNANRPTGTEVNQTAQTVTEMVPVVADALEKAQEAIDDAADAVTTSSGKNARRRGQTEPDPPPGGWAPGDQWIIDNADGVPYAVSVWNGTAFVPEQLLASELLVASGGGLVRLADGVVTADAVAADAIDGMLITGATIRTAPSGQRMQFDISGLVSYDSTGAQTSRIYSGSGGMELLGGLSLAYSGDDRTGSISPGGVGFSNPDPAGDQLSGLSSASLIINRGNVNTTPTGFNLELDHEGLFYRYKGSSGSQRDLEAFIGRSLSLDSLGENYTYVQADESRTVRTRTDDVSPRSGASVTVRASSAFATPEIRVDASVGSGVIHLDAPKVSFQGDRDWALITSTAQGPAIASLGSGVSHLNTAPYSGLRARIKAGVLYISGGIQRTGGYPANHVLFTLNLGFRPAVATVQYAYARGHDFVVANPDDGTVIIAVGVSFGAAANASIGLTIPLG